jgi:RNA polymerase sigma-70 factor (ECF subfamily)
MFAVGASGAGDSQPGPGRRGKICGVRRPVTDSRVSGVSYGVIGATEGVTEDHAVLDAPVVLLDFDTFYRANYRPLVALAYSMTGRLATAEEIVQESFLAAYKRWDRVAIYDDPVGYVRRIVTNRCVSAFRRGVTEVRLVARLRREPARPITLDETDDAVWQAIAQLPARQRQCLALVVLDQRAAPETAALLGISEDSVRTHVRRAKQRLADVLRVSTTEDET